MVNEASEAVIEEHKDWNGYLSLFDHHYMTFQLTLNIIKFKIETYGVV